ncbi:MAG: aminoacylase [Firmicutes bacterium HGW-Firmicutes-14]|nr:MAG: aminoacylase [Firmicutes bacterium HGW-Firmicutes-14]
MDLIIRKGRVIDGTGSSWFKADLGVKDGKVQAIGNLEGKQAALEIDAAGKYVAPGFLDIHQHSDITLLAGPSADSALKQGITTIVVGNCGHSASPVRDKQLLKSNIYGYQPEWGIDLEWTTVAGYIERLRREKPAVNVGTLIGHGAIRLAAMGFENRVCTPEELARMKALLIESLEQGALGLSTGLEYSPGKSAGLEEIVELVKVASNYQGIYATHIRNREYKFKEALEEAISTAKTAGTRLQICHVTPRFWTPGNATEMIIDLLEDARSEGLDAACDIYPYSFAAFTLGLFVPPWAFEDGNNSVLQYLKDRTAREKMKEYTNQPLAYMAGKGYWEKIILCTSNANPNLVGCSFAEIAGTRGVEPFDALLDVLLEEGDNFYNTLAYCITIDEKDIEGMIKYPNTVMMSDSYSLATRGVLKNTVMGPAAYSWTVHYLTHYIRNRKLLSLEEGIRRMTSLAAQRLGIMDRGLIRPGMWADLVVFDYDALADNATLANPNQHPSGIEHVFVNGGHVINNGEHTGNRYGSVILG